MTHHLQVRILADPLAKKVEQYMKKSPSMQRKIRQLAIDNQLFVAVGITKTKVSVHFSDAALDMIYEEMEALYDEQS